MKKIILFLLICYGGAIHTSAFSAALTRDTAQFNTKENNNIFVGKNFLTSGRVPTMTGKKLSLREKISWYLLNKKITRALKHGHHKKQEVDKGKLAMILGICGLAALLLPFVGVLSLPCAIAALILGYSARRENPSDKRARAGIVLGWVTVGLFVIALIIVIAVLTTSFAWY